jgi:hypothetical protein
MRRIIKESPRNRTVSRQPRPIVYIVCEGSQSEPRYFEGFRRRYSLIEIKTVASQHKDAYSLVQHAKSNIGLGEYYPDRGDQIWCVFDRDNNTSDNLTRAKQLAERRGYYIAFSNPCFEYWYLLHFTEHRGYLADCDAVVQKLQPKYIPNYKKSGDYFNMLRPMLPDAISRAENILIMLAQEGIPHISTESNPSTSAVSLVKELERRSME